MAPPARLKARASVPSSTYPSPRLPVGTASAPPLQPPAPPARPGSRQPVPPGSWTPGRPRTRAASRPRRRRWLLRTVTTLSMAVLASAGVGHVLVTGLDRGIARIDPFTDMGDRPAGGHGTNVLLVGTDGRERITEAQRRKYRLGGQPCHCTDTIMIVHISADRTRADVVSLPRDSYAVAPPWTESATGRRHKAHPVKLNQVYAEGGPHMTVRTVERMTHLKIDHYLEVDFLSFMKTVDELGGVKLCTATPLRDSHTGLALSPGTHRLDGGQALQYVRSRHLDGGADLSRMHRQQRFLAALIDRATSSGVLLNPVRFREVAGSVLGAVRADRGLNSTELLSLGHALRDLSPSSSEFTTVPIGTLAYKVPGIGSTLKWDRAKADRLFRALREDRPLTVRHMTEKTGHDGDLKKSARAGLERATPVAVDPRRIRVQVENGTGITGLGHRVDSALASVGFDTTRDPVNALERTGIRTVVRYDPHWNRSARSLAAALPGSELRPEPGLGPVLRVTAGAGFRRVVPVRAEDPYQSGRSVITGDEVLCP